MSPNPPPEFQAKTPRPAAMYVRISTEHQQFSTGAQANVIREYAERRGYEIVKTYMDEERAG